LGIFSIEPLKGVLKGGEEITIYTYFNPVIVGSYEAKIPVYLNKDYSEPSVEILLKGRSANPCIKFDRD